MKKIILFFALSIFLIGCNNPNFKEYYFQMKDFGQAKTYVFIDQNHKENLLNIRMYYKIVDSDTIFFTETLNPDNRPNEVFMEVINTSGSSMVDYYFINYTSNGEATEQPSNSLNKEVFSYSPDSYPLTWKVKTGIGKDSQTIIKKRSIIEGSNTINVLNESRACIVFKDEFIIQDDKSTTNFYQESYYAKGLGLVAYERFFADGYIMDFKLQEIK